jgi:hypothetical protein
MIAAPPASIPTHRRTMSNAEGFEMDKPVPYILAPEGQEPVNEAPRAIVVEPEAVEEEDYIAIRDAARILSDAGFNGLCLINVDPTAVAAHLREAIRLAGEKLA